MRAIGLLLVGGLLLWGASALANEGLQLRYRLLPDQVFYYTRLITATANLQLAAGQPLRLQIKARERMQRQVLGVLPDGSFRLQDRRLLNIWLNGQSLPVPVLGPQEIRLSPLGAQRAPAGSILSTLTPFGLRLPDLLPDSFIRFPPDALRPGTRWRTQAEVSLPDGSTGMLTVVSRFLGVEEYQGISCARVATEIALPSLALVGGAADPAGMLSLQGTASGDALHVLATGMPLRAQMKVKLRLEVRGAAAATPATAVGEAEAVIAEQLLPAADAGFSLP